MLIRSRKSSDVKSSEITPRAVFLDRRRFLMTAAVAGAGAVLSPAELLAGVKLPNVAKGRFSTDEALTPLDAVTTYNNFYEFGTGKTDPAENSKDFKPKPWSVTIDGEVGKPGVYDFEDLIRPHKLEERVYRLRCVEAWSMVIPWVGIPLGDIVKRVEPTGNAKYLAFETLFDPQRMPGQRRPVVPWPYVEGLRLDEAMHPLSILAVGLYGEELPNQNGAPLRLVVPWKYGFKSIKSIVRMSFVEKMPPTTWNLAAAHEYGFFANVNPEVDHPRWSQRKERRIGEFFKRDSLPFNGYADEVADLYSGMNLAKFY
jgi:methionine sulfoxide reductase catalytic subunit